MRTEIWIGAPPERVFEVLSEPERYADWVVGTRSIDRSDRNWPAEGAGFDHTMGIGPLSLADRTLVESVTEPRRLVLQARLYPLGSGRVTLDLQPDGGGTWVTLDEEPADLRARLLALPPAGVLVRVRNGESLARLKELVEARS